MKYIFMVLTLVLGSTLKAQDRYISTTDGVELHIRDKGMGPVCLYIHGGPGSGSNWLEEFMGDYLEQNFRMIYLDQRGVGRSTTPSDGNYSLERMVLDFEEVRTALNIDKWFTLGHSFGGILQMGYVKEFPESISGMMIINCTLDMNDSFGNSWLPKAMELAGGDTPEACHDSALSVYRKMLAIMPVLGQKDLMWKIFFNDQADSWKMNSTYSEFEEWNGDQSEKILEFTEYWADFSSSSPHVKQPVLFYYGKQDWAIGPMHYSKAKFPKMLLWGSEVGHMPFLENKADLMEAINQYLKKYF